MIEPITSLAYSMASNKGVYAILLGSGISKVAEIPTGWDITLELIRRLAKIQKEDFGSDPLEWYRQRYEEEAEYSSLLNHLAKTPSERANLLKEFFEPSQDEIERGVKIPTKAHKAIAELVSHGYIKVIVTTNFDRLTEKALENIGIVPIVLSTSDSVEGSLPLVHNNCTILKVNGDYLDTRIRNISSELENYEEPINQLLDRIFDEFGLIICGWSAKWDIALRKAIERCKNHRFTTYWADITDLDGPGKKLAELRRAIFIPIKDADNFFFELSESVLSLENYHRIHPLSLEISVSRLKKYLVDDRYRIELYDLVNNEKEMLHDNISEIYFPINPKQPPTNEEFANRMRKYEDVTQIVLALMINGCYWGKDVYKSIWVSIIERVSAMSDWSGYTDLASLRLYPALILLYGGCIASLANGNYGTFGSLLTEPVIRDLHEEVPAVMNLNCYKVLDFNIAKQIPLDEMQGKAAPLSNRLYNILKEPFKSFLADDIKYQRTFDKFEYLMALIHADLRKEQGRNPWGPEGCFSWRYRYSSEYNVFDDIESDVNRLGENWPLLKEGLFGGSVERFESVKSDYDKYIATVRW